MIITDESKLRVDCVDATPEEIPSIIDQLERELQRSAELGRPGIGLAAPQIGINKNIAIVRIPNSGGMLHRVDLVNCRIEKGYDEARFENEGCLSFPGKFVTSSRYQEIYVVNNAVEPYRFSARGLFAACCQHELDHLVGKLLPDFAIK